MFNFRKKNNTSDAVDNSINSEEPIIISAEVMDNAFDRSPGRDCSICGFFGSHHTDKHNEFARAALEKARC